MRSLTDLLRAAGSILGDAFDVFRHTMTLGALSLALAVVTWFAVSDAENPPETDFYTGGIPVEAINVPQGKAPASFEPAQVRVKITADKDVWDELSIEDFKATVDLSGMTKTEASPSVIVTAMRNDVKIVQVTPSTVHVVLEPVTTQSKPVKIKTLAPAPQGFQVTDETVTPETVQVTGPQSLVQQTDAVWVDLNLSTVQISMEQDFTLTARGKDGGVVDVHIEPNTARVSVTVVRTEWTVTFPVNPSISGNVAVGYRAASVEVDRPFVNVRGPADVLQSISSVTTDTIPVDGAESDVQRSVQIRVPPGATVEGGTDVVVSVRIVPAEGQRNFEIAVQTTGLREGMSATVSPDGIVVTVAGPLPSLDSLAADAITARIDVTDLASGTYRLTPKITLPTDAQLVAVSPADVQVTVSGQ